MSLAVVTGGSRGIGKAICLKLAEIGYDVAFCYSSNEAAALEVVEECNKFGVCARAFKANVADEASVSNFASQVLDQCGPVDVLVNNAGITKDGLLIRMKEEDFDKVLNVNLKGTFFMTKAFLPSMMKRKYGSIVNITSVVGIMGNAGQANYAASKAGIIGFTQSVAKEYGGKGIRANAVAPGFISTEMTESLDDATKEKYFGQIPLKRFGSAKDVANAVAFLAGEDSAYITGQVLSVNGGMR